MRAKFVNFIIIFIFLFFGISLFNLQILKGRQFKEASLKNYLRLLPQSGSRGRIFDCNGKVIVDNCLSYDVMLLKQSQQDLKKIFKKLSSILEIEPKDLENTYKKEYIASSLPITIVKNLDVKKAIALGELKADLGNIIIQPHPVRNYPYGKTACHLIGYLGEIDRWRLTKLADYGYKTKDIVGYAGIEERYDYYLRGEDGALSIEVDNQGRFVRLLGFKSARSGKDITLTIDLRLQKIVEEALEGRNGCVIIMQPYTGEVLALASYPNFNPEVFIKKTNISMLLRNPESVLFNRAISGLYPAASVFKLISVVAGLETGKIKPSTTFNCTGNMEIGGRQFGCWDVHGQENLMQGIIHSCDVYFYHVGLILGAQLIYDYALKFGFGRPTGIDLPYESAGLVPNPLWKRIHKLQKWFEGDTANLTIGQGYLLVTPMQMARMMALFVNGGFLVPPHIVKSIEGVPISFPVQKAIKISLKKDYLNFIRQALRRVISEPDGTAHILADLPVEIAGKTGSAQVSGGSPHGWFVGFFPFKNPKFTICVLLEHAGSGYAAALLTKQIIEAMIKEGLI